MARLFLTSGQSFGTIGAGLATDIFGTSGNETVNVEANGDAVFDPSFNAGGDTINLGGNAASYTGSISGSNLVLTSAGGANIVIPFGTAGLTINFNDADGRVLRVSGGSLLLGSQTIAAGGVAIAAGTGGSGGGGSSGNTSMQAVDTDEPYLVGDYELTENTDTINGTSGGDTFRAGKAQISEIGGVSNTLSSADRIFGGGGLDHLFAVVVPEFFSGNGSLQVDVQPLIRSVERIEIEASDLAVSGHFVVNDRPSSTDTQVDVSQSPPNFVNQIIIVDAKDMRDIDHIGSFNSDGDLVIENLNTLTSGGVARNTEAVTITMDHTDNVNSDCDASDLHVYFDDDYLLAGQSTTTSQANYWLLDEDSADYVNVPLLNVERNGVRFSIDGNAQTIRVADSAADVPDSWELYAAALQQDINDQIAAGNTILVGLTVVVDYNNTDSTFNDFGQQVTIPAITILDAQGREFSALGYITPEDSTGAFDIYGRFDTDPSEQFDNPITVNIELNKVGRNGYGGDLIIGGKNGDKGIEVFKVKVEGVGDDDPSQDVAKPSNLGTLASNGGALEEVYITTAPEFVDGDTFASLTIRDGFGDRYNGWDNPSVPGYTAPNDLRLVDATGFFGDLSLGTSNAVVNLDTLIATGGGDVVFYGYIDGNEENQPYSYTTGSGSDYVDLYLDGDGLDYAQSSVTVSTGSGKDEVVIGTKIYGDDEVINQAILHNIVVNTGSEDDKVWIDAGSRGNTIINTGTGNDSIFTDGGSNDYAAWVFNWDDANQPSPSDDEDLTGVQVAPMYLAGATVRVALSGAGVSDLNDGGGVMAVNNLGDADAIQTDGYRNGYESAVTITSLISGRNYFGDQRDINAAVLKAINEHPILGQLLHAEIKENNTLVVYSLTSGDFQALDLEITVDQANWGSVQQGDGVVLEARALTGNSAITHADVWGVTSAQAQSDATVDKPNYQFVGLGPKEGDPADLSDPSTDANPNYNSELYAYYTGLGVDNAQLLWGGDASDKETDNTINGGAGNDLIVLSTDSSGPNTPAMTVSTGNSLINGESNETIVLEDFFGNDTVMNFETAYQAQTSAPSGSVTTFSMVYEDGLDFLNFLDYLTSEADTSDNSNGTPDTNASENLIPVTLDYDVPATLVDQAANEVSIVRLNPTSTASFAGVTETVIENLFNHFGTTTFDYGNLDDSVFYALDEYTAQGSPNFTDELVNTAKGILMVENGANLGEYKVFELDWNGNDTADTNSTSNGLLSGTNDRSDGGVVNAVLVGTLDFGTSLDGIHEINLVGSVTYGALITSGWNGVAV